MERHLNFKDVIFISVITHLTSFMTKKLLHILYNENVELKIIFPMSCTFNTWAQVILYLQCDHYTFSYHLYCTPTGTQTLLIFHGNRQEQLLTRIGGSMALQYRHSHCTSHRHQPANESSEWKISILRINILSSFTSHRWVR